jgi:hypothetical protein
VQIVLKYGSLNLLEPSGPVKACNGIALPNEQSYRWLQCGDVKGEPDIMTAQDTAIRTKHFKNNMPEEETDSKWLLRKQHEATTNHLTLGSHILAKKQY